MTTLWLSCCHTLRTPLDSWSALRGSANDSVRVDGQDRNAVHALSRSREALS